MAVNLGEELTELLLYRLMAVGSLDAKIERAKGIDSNETM